MTRLADESMRNVTVGPKDTWAVGTDITPYEREQGIRGFAFRDIYAVNVNTGERKLIQKKVPGDGGGGGRGGGGAASNFSPDGGRYLYYDTGDYKLYDFATGSDEDDQRRRAGEVLERRGRPQRGEAADRRRAGRLGEGRRRRVRARQLGRVAPAGERHGAAVNITGNGLKDQIKYQARSISDPKDRGIIDPAKPLYFETYGEWTKKEGLSQVDPVKGGAKVLSWENDKVDYRRARDADVWLYARQTVVKYPGLVRRRRQPLERTPAHRRGSAAEGRRVDTGSASRGLHVREWRRPPPGRARTCRPDTSRGRSIRC